MSEYQVQAIAGANLSWIYPIEMRSKINEIKEELCRRNAAMIEDGKRFVWLSWASEDLTHRIDKTASELRIETDAATINWTDTRKANCIESAEASVEEDTKDGWCVDEEGEVHRMEVIINTCIDFETEEMLTTSEENNQ